MTALRRTYAELEDALGNALTKIEELESVNDGLEDDLEDARRERVAAVAEQCRLQARVERLEATIKGVRDAMRRV